MAAGHVVPLDAVVVDVVEDGQALAARLGLRAAAYRGSVKVVAVGRL